jgi:hypothetical protein
MRGPYFLLALNTKLLGTTLFCKSITTRKSFLLRCAVRNPVAKGKRGTLEKKVVFQIASKLTALINKQPGMKAIMVRKGDY